MSAYLLSLSRAGALPFVEIVPEGLEDIDCRDDLGGKWLVQTKEAGAGAGRFTAADVAEVISHAADAASTESRIVVITDASLGSQLVETGWDRSIAETPGYDTASALKNLVSRGHTESEAGELLTRAHLVRVPWNVSPRTTFVISELFEINPSAASIVTLTLLDELGQLAADQRFATAESPGLRQIGDLDALVIRVLNTVDVDSLDSAVRAGVCEFADYAAPPAMTLGDFLLGVDVVPAHIGASFDVIRPAPSREVQVALEQARYALVSGPSGSGKSAQMWRSARDVSPGARVVRVRRVESDADVTELVRYVALLRPSFASRVVVCCDDVGRPNTKQWPDAASRLLEQPEVNLIGAVRSEDFTAPLLSRAGVLIRLELDDETASTIADQLSQAGVNLALHIPEAVQAADGQLMEFVALLTTGRRLEVVLTGQAERILLSDDPLEADIARLVCTADTLGVVVHSDRLLESASTDMSTITKVLSRLQNEHIVTTEDGESWRGLHQRRSDVLVKLLHATPPPALTSTLSRVLAMLDPLAVGWALRRVAELFDRSLEGVAADAVSRCRSAVDLAVLMEGLERADNSLTAAAYVPVLERFRKDPVSMSALAMMVCSTKIAGMTWGDGSPGPLATMARHIDTVCEELPDRSTVYCDAAANALSLDALVGHLTSSELVDSVRLLESVSPYIKLSSADLARVFDAFLPSPGLQPLSELQLRSRLTAAAWVACARELEFADGVGPLDDRFRISAMMQENLISADLDGLHATVELLSPLADTSLPAALPWDLPSTRKGASDSINDYAVSIATIVGDSCPELDIVEVRTVIADGSALRIGDFEPGHKRLGRDARPDRSRVRVNVGVMSAIERTAAAFSWTEIVRVRADTASRLVTLLSDGPRRLSPHDNAARRKWWRDEVASIERLLGGIRTPPASKALDSVTSAASWDADRGEDTIVLALRELTTAMASLVQSGAEQPNLLAVASQVETAVVKLQVEQSEPDRLLADGELDSLKELHALAQELRQALVATAFDSTVATRLKGQPEQLRAAISMAAAAVAQKQIDEELGLLQNAFGTSPAFVSAPDPDVFVTSVEGHQWCVLANPDQFSAVVESARLAAEGGTELPVVRTTILCEADDALLPIALRLSKMTGSGVLPLDPDDIDELGAILGLRTVRGENFGLVTEVGHELVAASWQHARQSLRPRGWPPPPQEAEQHLSRALDLLTPAAELDLPHVEPLLHLAALVREELSGSGVRPVAADLSDPSVLNHDEVDPDTPIALFARAAFVAMDADLLAASTSV